MLSYNPNRFFNELERNSTYKKKALRESFRRAQKSGLVERTANGYLLTKLGRETVELFRPSQLIGSQLMVIFDVPESKANERAQFRRLLKRLGFEQVQKSVWATQYDYRAAVRSAVLELNLKEFVALYECAKLS